MQPGQTKRWFWQQSDPRQDFAQVFVTTNNRSLRIPKLAYYWLTKQGSAFNGNRGQLSERRWNSKSSFKKGWSSPCSMPYFTCKETFLLIPRLNYHTDEAFSEHNRVGCNRIFIYQTPSATCLLSSINLPTSRWRWNCTILYHLYYHWSLV